jgi:hypothetical protein
MSTTINHETLAARLTRYRLRSYLAASGGDFERAIALYDWNVAISGALHEDLGRLEVVFRNALDSALVRLGTDRGWPTVWYQRMQLFPGKHSRRVRQGIAVARARAGRPGRSEVHGKVIASDLGRDHQDLLAVAGWICPDTREWIAGASRYGTMLA